MQIIRRRLRFWLPVFFLFLVFCTPLKASAAYAAKITNCQVNASGKVKVTASIPNLKNVSGSKCYLFALSMSESKIPASAKPLISRTKASKLTFSVSLNNSKTTSLLYSRFILASKTSKGVYKIISNSRFVANPDKLAKYKYSFPTAVSKKGLQVSSNMLEDAEDLNISHAALNIVLSDLIATDLERNSKFSVSFKYHGKTFWFRKALVNSYDAYLTALKRNDVVVSAILLMGWRDDLKHLIYPDGRARGHSYYAWNVSNASAREEIQAAIAFLASRYATSSAKHGRIVNWIVGNEVNNYSVYNYAGSKTLKQYAKICAKQFRLTYNTVTGIYANARVYLSLDHLWNTKVSGAFTARELLDAFASALKSQGNINWNLAYHAYSSPLTEPKFWANTNKQLTAALTTPVINMGNLSVLTSYIRQKYGSNTRIILSEQGYTSVRHSGAQAADAQAEQSAAIAYSYYLAEADDMIDSFIMNRHVDHQAEIAQGLDLGLWTTDAGSSLPEWADSRKQSWEVFKYMDSNLSEQKTAGALDVIGIDEWSDVLPGFNRSLYSRNFYASADLQEVSGYRSAGSIPTSWDLYGAASRKVKGNGAFRVFHNSIRNRNSLWGLSQTFKNGLNFSSAPVFYTTLKVHGATDGRARVRIRFRNGRNILECSRVIRCDASVPVGVSLQNWYYQVSVSEIQVLVEPVSGSWSADAYLRMTAPVRGL